MNMYEFAKKLWPLNRSITGEGVRETLAKIKEHLPGLKTFEVPTGTRVFDWTVPKEWRVKEAWIKTPKGKKICSFNENNLHLVGYSTPFNGKMSLAKLSKNLFSLPDQPGAIPYVTSYYKEDWGFCITQNERDRLEDGIYEVFIDSELFNGSLTYGELLLKGKSSKEVFLSTYVCHPSMANNEISGPVVTTFLSKWISELVNKKYTYRIIFIPETIGSITYLSRNLEILKENVEAGFNITCIGDNLCYSYLPSRAGDTLSDRVSKHVLKHIDPDFKQYSWLDRGSDERQYCAPGIDIPVATIMRSKYGEYPEYHTSLDDLSFISPSGLEGGLKVLKLVVKCIESNCFPKAKLLGEPQLGKRGLYPNLSVKGSADSVKKMMDLLTYADGKNDLINIAELIDVPAWDLIPIMSQLVEYELFNFN